MRPAAKTRTLPAQDARVPAPQRVSSARVVAPKVRPDAPQSSSSAPTPSPEFAHPALSGHTKDGRSSDPVGAPAIEAELVQDAAPVSERGSVASAAGRHTVPQPADESRTPPVTDNAPEIDQLDDGALRVLNSKLTFLERWHLLWAIEKAVYVREAMSNTSSGAKQQ